MSPGRVALASAGTFLLAALVFGVAKFRAMTSPPGAKAPPYVDVGHRAALSYAFAAAVVERMLSASALPPWAQWGAAGTALALFALTILRYAQLAVAGGATSQYAEPSRGLSVATWLLAAGEIGAVTVLLAGTLAA